MIITVLNSLVWRVKLFKGFLEIFQIIKYGRSVWEFPPLPLYGQKINWKTLIVSVVSQVLPFLQQGLPRFSLRSQWNFFNKTNAWQ